MLKFKYRVYFGANFAKQGVKMHIDLLHNRIIADCISPRFTECVDGELVPLLTSAIEGVEGILMYEDHLADNLMLGGEWYYPLTVFVEGVPEIRWIKWTVGDGFRGGCPYSYYGAGDIGFSLVTDIPDGFEDALLGRAISYPDGCIKLRVVGVKKDPTFLVGRYSQSFVDEMARQISDELVRKLSVERVDNGTLEIQLVFAGDTYMEHTSDRVTYRRLLLTDKGCQPRDFWIKWTRLDDGAAYTIRDNVSPENIIFELGEDVPQKIREKEYRFLCRSNPDKYQSAMGKRTVTEWRELIKRSIKRGELVKIELAVTEIEEPRITPVTDTDVTEALITTPKVEPVPEAAPTISEEDDLDRRLKAILGDYAAAVSAEEVPEVDDSDITMMARAALGVAEPAKSETKPEDDYVFGIDLPEEIETGDTDSADESDADDTDLIDGSNVDENPADDSEEYTDLTIDECIDEHSDEYGAPVIEETAAPIDESLENADVDEDEVEEETAEADTGKLLEDELRRELEAKIRRELEEEARAKANEEAERVRAEHDRLREENEKLREEARRREEERLAQENKRIADEERRLEEERARKEEEERTRIRIAEQARIEEAERARLAEIARNAIEEQKRVEEERRIREERERAENAAREAARQREEAERLERERLAREEEERRRAQPVFITKHARLIFRRPVDVNVIARIKEIVEFTLVENQKAHVHIYMKAYPIDSYTINLDMKLPEEEGELLVTLVKAIGNGHLGITKIIVE